MTSPKPRVLVVCSNKRAEELRDVLQTDFEVYLRKYEVDENSGSAYWRDYLPKGKTEMDHPASSGSCDVLFFHVSGNDPAGIPENLKTKKEFGFSDGALTATDEPAGRAAAIPIQRRFGIGNCPVKKRHIKELIAFLDGTRSEQPLFCRHEDSLPVLNAIAIVCQAYAGALASAHGAESLSAWGDLKQQLGGAGKSLKQTYHSLHPFLRQMQTQSWWKSHLGFWDLNAGCVDDDALKDLLVRLVYELEIDVSISKSLGINESDELWKISGAVEIKAQLAKLNEPECTKKVIDFLYSSDPWEHAANVYTSIEAYLKKR